MSKGLILNLSLISLLWFEVTRAKGLQRDDYRIKALIENGKVMTKDHEGNIKTITLRETSP
jgi:hypothetical protein